MYNVIKPLKWNFTKKLALCFAGGRGRYGVPACHWRSRVSHLVLAIWVWRRCVPRRHKLPFVFLHIIVIIARKMYAAIL